MLKGIKKNEDKEQGKTLKHEAPCSINHKATLNKNNTRTTALERPVAQTTAGGGGLKYFLLSTNAHLTAGPGQEEKFCTFSQFQTCNI